MHTIVYFIVGAHFATKLLNVCNVSMVVLQSAPARSTGMAAAVIVAALGAAAMLT